jgi:hypothetical protein
LADLAIAEGLSSGAWKKSCGAIFFVAELRGGFGGRLRKGFAVKIHCPHCQKDFEVGADTGGKTARCGSCGGRFQIPLPVAAVVELRGAVKADVGLDEGLFNLQKPVVIEQTAKRYKLAQLVGFLMAIISLVVCFTDLPHILPSGLETGWVLRIGIAGFLLGFLICLSGKAMAWWEHG